MKGYASKGPWNHRYTPSITGWYSSPQDMIARREKTHASSPSTSGKTQGYTRRLQAFQVVSLLLQINS